MDFTEDNLDRLSELLEKIKTLEAQQCSICSQQRKKFHDFSEQLVKINVEIENFSREIARQEHRDWELEDSMNKMNERIQCYGMNITEQMQDIKYLHNTLDEYHKEVTNHLLRLETTLRSEYLSNASFTKLQRNALWAVTSFLGAIILNFVVKAFIED